MDNDTYCGNGHSYLIKATMNVQCISFVLQYSSDKRMIYIKRYIFYNLYCMFIVYININNF